MATSIYEQESVLLEHLENGNQEAFKWFYEKYRAPLLVLALSLLKDEAEAEDLVQDYFIDFWEKKSYQKIDPSKQTAGAASFIKPYILRSVRNRCLDKLGQRQTINKKMLDLPEQHSIASPEEEIQEREWIEEIRLAIAAAEKEVPPSSAQVFDLIYHQDKTRNEAAAEMGISPHTVKNQLARAIKILRVQLKNISL